MAADRPDAVWRALRRLIRTVASASPRRAAGALACALVLSAFEACGLMLLVPLLQLVGLDASQGALGRLDAGVARALHAAAIPITLATVLAIYVLVAVAQSVLQRWQAGLVVGVQQDVVTTMRARVYRAMAGARWEFFVRQRTSVFTHVLTDEVDRVGLAAYYALDLVATLGVAAAYVGLALRVSPGLTGVVLVCGAALAVATRGAMRAANESGEAFSTATGRLYAAIAEHLGGMKAAKAFGAEARHADLFEQAAGDVDAVGRTMTRLSARMRQRLTIGSALVLAGVVYASRAWLAVPAAALLLMLFLFARLMPRVTAVPDRLQTIATLLPALGAVRDLEARCRAAAEPAPAASRPIAFAREIRFEHVVFSYAGSGGSSERRALSGLSLDIPAGSVTAIVGPSGAGKTTVADILMGLIEPEEGRVLVDGEPLGPEVREAWRAQIGYVPQDTFLFHESVRANLRWARPEATDADIERALATAAASPFVQALPLGLETIVGDRGAQLSGGERQRLSLARALLRQPRLLVLDEATSSLDSENETHILDALAALRARATVVIISHRLSTLRDADRIHVMEQGRVVESGTWTELSRRQNGRLRAMSEAQGFERQADRPARLREVVNR